MMDAPISSSPQSPPTSGTEVRNPETAETLDQLQARHRKELRELQNRVTSKKKNATKKNRKAVNSECDGLERGLRDTQEREAAALAGSPKASPQLLTLEEDEAKIAANLEALGFEDESPASPAADAAQLQTGKKRNRNRQRERLARRAAEQEEAAVRAEEEAASMVDRRKIESAHMRAEMESNALVEHEVRPDGHCLFSAIADQLQQLGIPIAGGAGEDNEKPTEAEAEGVESAESAAPYRTVRHRAADYMQVHSHDFEPFMEEPMAAYTETIRNKAEWGGHLELMALARAYDVEIRVVQEGRTERIVPAHVDDERKVAWLAYYRHGYGLGEHYNSLRAKGG